jgi:beta-lactamase regulating signal transducer with metallopeptidase domain
MTHLLELAAAAVPTRAIALFLAAWWVKGALILALGWVAARLLRQRSAATRHLAWALAIVAALAAPAASPLLPELGVPLPERVLARGLAVADLALPPGIAESEGSLEAAPLATGSVVMASPEPALALTSDGRSLQAAGVAATAASATGSTAGPTRPRTPGREIDWASVAVALWLTGAVLLLLRSAAGRVARRAMLRGAVPAPAAWHALVDGAPEGLRIRRRLRLVVSPRAPVAMTWGVLRPVVVLPAAARSWTLARLRDTIFHELAHVRRLDVVAQSAAELLCALAWIDPLAWVARRRLRREAEHACDDAILAAGTRPSLYAGHLLVAARGLRKHQLRVPATAIAMARTSGLSDRIGAVLDERRSRGAVRGGSAALWTLTALAISLPLAALAPAPLAPPAAPAAPAVPAAPPAPAAPTPIAAPGAPAPPAAPAARPAPPAVAAPAAPSAPAAPAAPPSSPTSTFSGTVRLSNTSDEPTEGYFTQPRFRGQCEPGLLTGRTYGNRVEAEDNHWRIVLHHGSCSLEIELEGDIRLAADDRGIERLGRGARLTIEEDAEATRKLVVTSGPGGEPEYRWSVDGDARPYGAEARRWLIEVLPEVFRTTGIQAPERVARFLEEGGVPAVLAEIRQMSSDHVQRLYFDEVLRQRRLTPAEAERLLAAAGETIGSDHALAELLSRFPSAALAGRAVQQAFVQAASTLGSDHEAGRVLKSLLRRGDLDRETIEAVMAITADIGSDHELAEVLVAALDAYPRDRPLPRSFFAAAATIGSDHEHGRTLRTAIDRGRLDDATVEGLLRSAKAIGSDHELAELLVHLARRAELDGPLRDRYLETAKGIGSRSEHDRALAALAASGRAAR